MDLLSISFRKTDKMEFHYCLYGIWLFTSIIGWILAIKGCYVELCTCFYIWNYYFRKLRWRKRKPLLFGVLVPADTDGSLAITTSLESLFLEKLGEWDYLSKQYAWKVYIFSVWLLKLILMHYYFVRNRYFMIIHFESVKLES